MDETMSLWIANPLNRSHEDELETLLLVLTALAGLKPDSYERWFAGERPRHEIAAGGIEAADFTYADLHCLEGIENGLRVVPVFEEPPGGGKDVRV